VGKILPEYSTASIIFVNTVASPFTGRKLAFNITNAAKIKFNEIRIRNDLMNILFDNEPFLLLIYPLRKFSLTMAIDLHKFKIYKLFLIQ
jgi:hypothetical protein